MVWRTTVDDIAAALEDLQMTGYESCLSSDQYGSRQSRRFNLHRTLQSIGIELGDDPGHPQLECLSEWLQSFRPRGWLSNASKLQLAVELLRAVPVTLMGDPELNGVQRREIRSVMRSMLGVPKEATIHCCAHIHPIQYVARLPVAILAALFNFFIVGVFFL